MMFLRYQRSIDQTSDVAFHVTLLAESRHFLDYFARLETCNLAFQYQLLTFQPQHDWHRSGVILSQMTLIFVQDINMYGISKAEA